MVKCAFRKVSMDRITFLDSLVPKMMLVVNFFILRNWGRVGRLASSPDRGSISGAAVHCMIVERRGLMLMESRQAKRRVLRSQR